MIPTVDLAGLTVSRLIIGGNPFSGFSHQSAERDNEMLDYYTVGQIKETLRRAEACSITTAVMRSDPHIQRMLREYYNEGGTIQWIAQVGADSGTATVDRAIEVAVSCGAKAVYIHGALVDDAYARQDADQLRQWVARIRDHGLPAGLAGHAPEAHLWAYEEDIADFHAVSFYNCGSLHTGGGDKFPPDDPPRAVEAIRHISKPCIGYKILGAGRVPASEGLEYAFARIKPRDAVNLGMYRGDNDGMVEENAATVERLLQSG